jgi:hypothetical protein
LEAGYGEKEIGEEFIMALDTMRCNYLFVGNKRCDFTASYTLLFIVLIFD